MILLGSPRGEHQADVTELLNYVHLWPKGCVTLKGAHEWRYPRVRDNAGYVKHSIERNLEILLRLIAEERLKVRELVFELPDGARPVKVAVVVGSRRVKAKVDFQAPELRLRLARPVVVPAGQALVIESTLEK